MLFLFATPYLLDQHTSGAGFLCAFKFKRRIPVQGCHDLIILYCRVLTLLAVHLAMDLIGISSPNHKACHYSSDRHAIWHMPCDDRFFNLIEYNSGGLAL